MRCLSLVRPASVLAGLVAAATLVVAVPADAWQPINSCRPVWSPRTLPSRYHVNQNGYSLIPLETVRQVLRDGFDAWEQPCCSAWRAEEVGVTSGVGEDPNNPQNIISFRETTWPRELGDGRSVLAVTLTTWFTGRGGCEGLTADMVFNGVNHTYGTSASRTVTDLQAVATHEQGHWLGLGHTPIQSATMFEAYIGESARELHPDDVDGVCALYPGSCTCSSDGDCAGEDVCDDGVCVTPRCASSADCADGLSCDVASGRCVVPPCESDDDCVGSEVCRDGSCILEGDCPICAPCRSQAECGAAGFCVDAGDETGFCVSTCNSAADCPGNTDCFSVPGESFNICANEDAVEAGLCPAGFVCTTEASLCDGVSCPTGQFCDEATGRCLSRDACFVCETCRSDADCPGGECVTFDGRNLVCIVPCDGGASCPTSTSCFSVSDEGGGTASYCLNSDAASAGACPAGFVCDDNVNLCADVRCPAGEACDPLTGRCRAIPDTSEPDGSSGGSDSGGGGPEPAGDCSVCARCSSDAACGEAATCTRLNGVERCVFPCETDSDCPGDSACFDISAGSRICLNRDAGSAGVCPDDYVCREPVLPVPVDPTDTVEEDAADGADVAGPTDAAGGLSEAVPSTSEGCACSAAASPGGTLPLLLLAPLALRRRRRSENP